MKFERVKEAKSVNPVDDEFSIDKRFFKSPTKSGHPLYVIQLSKDLARNQLYHIVISVSCKQGLGDFWKPAGLPPGLIPELQDMLAELKF